MDVVSQISPVGSVSPPISPIKFVQPSSSLPPVRSMPTWNRTSLGRSKVLTSIVKDTKTAYYTTEFENKLCLQNSSKCTQTSPPTTTQINSNTLRASVSDTNVRVRPTVNNEITDRDSKPSGIEKKLVFIHSRHEDILSRLHSEVDRLKNENKELNFKLVMNSGSFHISSGKQDKVSSATKPSERPSASKNASAATRSSVRKKAEKLEEVKVIFLKEEVNDLKNALRDAKNKNTHLTQTINSQKQRTKSSSTSAKKSDNFGHLPGNKFPYRNPPLPPVEASYQRKVSSPLPKIEPNYFDKSSHSSSGKEGKIASGEYQQMIRHLQQMNAKQAHELNKFRNKYENQKRLTIEDAHRRSEEKFPRLHHGITSKSAKITDTKYGITDTKYGKHDGIVLPALRTTHGHKLADRQKKAQAMHVQRQQRSNREFSQKLL